jgi:HTH-type transcriptional regulator/antitoxin MqsA
MKCAACGASGLVHETRDVTYTYKGRTTLIPGVVADWCGHCGERSTDVAESKQVLGVMKAFQKSVNAEAVEPEFIVRVRENLHLNQQQAAKVFGGGANAFSRYETGKTRPPKTLVTLFKLLEKHPELYAEIE